MLSVEDARTRILSALSPVGEEVVALSAAAGRVLSAPVIARRTQPPADFSAMDGYAVRSTECAVLPASLTVIGESRAGLGYDKAVEPGQAVRIFTGAPLPEGADAVVIQENTEKKTDQSVQVLHKVAMGDHIRRAGIDFNEGDRVLEAGTGLEPRHIALAAAANVPWLSVVRKPRIALLSTGDELVRPGEPLGRDGIIDAVGPALSAMIRARGGVVHSLDIAKDRHEALKAAANAAKGCDMLVTIGGASVGDYDLVRDAFGKEGLALDFWKIAMRPGKPMIFGRLGATAMLGLPGNPVSALVCALLFMGPAIDRLSGRSPRMPLRLPAILGAALPENGPREAYLRASLEAGNNGLCATPFPQQDSSILSGFANADALIIRPPFAPKSQAGDKAEALLLDASIGS
ncbi:molybdopterin molybdenumtransferase MoeA [Iodidimonas muriae]|uniref:Molybdopterin molybdenumtransferase n=1 Tax=Iodidimonas muriae TaxID=261467 RepID=A0ABQ2LEH0_9PROT|nr:gephyrin-like molybdotransferase Glp [Iodidimonas muriae]GGO13529.1 molybdopterin molybdenumtransferase MoeA [Iodidimonas muriae]